MSTTKKGLFNLPKFLFFIVALIEVGVKLIKIPLFILIKQPSINGTLKCRRAPFLIPKCMDPY